MASVGPCLNVNQQKDEFHRVISLHYESVADLLREFTSWKLEQNKSTVRKFIQKCHTILTTGTKKNFVNQNQLSILSSPTSGLNDMDVTMLTMLLLNCGKEVSLSVTETKLIQCLRDHRNEIAHNFTGRLTDTSLYNKTSNDCISLSASLPIRYQQSLKESIEELRQREFLRRFSTLEVLHLSMEQFEVILIQSEERRDGTTMELQETILKYNLTKWAKQICRGINVHSVIDALRKKNVIDDEAYKMVNEVSSECEKAPFLIEYFVKCKQKTRTDILILCEEIRSSHSPYLADLIEGNNTDGKDASILLKKDLHDRIKDVLIKNLMLVNGKYETAENVHIFVEEQIGHQIEFVVLEDVMKKTFDCQTKDGRYDGICFSINQSETEGLVVHSEGVENVGAMSFEQYAEFVGNQFKFHSEELCVRISSQIKNEFIQMEDFVKLNDGELTEVFSSSTEPNRLEFGIKKVLKKVQAEIKKQIGITCTKNVTDNYLRPFNKPFRKPYEQCEITYDVSADLHHPAHGLVYQTTRKMTKHLIMKESVKFIAACVNGRKNGTLHFGLKRLSRNKAEIIGLEIENNILDSLDSIIDEGFERCFGHLQESIITNMKKCVKPAHVIPIADQEMVVIEIDVIPEHIYLGSTPTSFEALFPPNGPQIHTVFLMIDKANCEIGIIAEEKLESTRESIVETIEERKRLDLLCQKSATSAYELSQILERKLARGADYITDEFYPILVAGKVTDQENKNVFEYPGLHDAFQNSFAVFDFNSSTELRRKTENGTPMFEVKSTDELKHEDDCLLVAEKDKLWVYCNGNDDKRCPVVEKQTWVKERMNKLENVLRGIKKRIPSKRAKVILLMFEDVDNNDPFIEFALAVFIRLFQNSCTIIAETEGEIRNIQVELSSKMGFESVNPCLFYGLKWEYVCKVFRKIFRESSEDSYKIPNSSGTFEEIKFKEKENWKSIEIMSMEECILEDNKMNSEERKNKAEEEKRKFYRGNKASWWNFYYKHVGERDLFSKLRNIIESKLTRQDGKMLVECMEMRHFPGAGGSTLGQHLLWYFSQKICCLKPYRCCTVKQLSENTVHEIESFRDFKDKKPRPVIILLDQMTNENLLVEGLQRLAYKTAIPGELFGLVINISRVSLLESSDEIPEGAPTEMEIKHTLRHQLGRKERVWFDDKYSELVQSAENIYDVNSLLAFNFMRNDFSPEHMKRTVEEIMKDTKPYEIDILKILSVVCNFKTGTLVPECIFDSLVPVNTYSRRIAKPFGMRKRETEDQPPEILNSKVIGLFVSRAGYVSHDRGLSVICQPLAHHILEYIKTQSQCHLEDVIMAVLSHMENHIERQDSADSRRFVDIICSLFRTRLEKDKNNYGSRDTFSLLISALHGKEKKDEDNERVIRVMQRCFALSNDAFVGQQLARFHIKFTKNWDAAEVAISESIKMIHDNSYLFDTYGQVFRRHMECEKESNSKNNMQILKIARLAFSAIDKFVEGQGITKEFEQDRNMSVYHMEVKTLISLLEIFTKSENFTDEDDLRGILSRSKADLNGTFLSFLHQNGMLEPLLLNGRIHAHASLTLRFLEENNYQVKQIRPVYIDDDVLLLDLRESFERFYCCHGLQFRLKFGYGLKPLMLSYKRKENTWQIRQRFEHAQTNLETLQNLDKADARDLLFYIGYRFTEIISNDENVSDDMFRKLLNYSAMLVDKQSEFKRPYLESYLYFAMFHWPAPSRLKFSNLTSYNTYRFVMEKWERAFFDNNFVSTLKQRKNYKGKNYFALGKTQLAVIDLNDIELEWRRKKEEEGRTRMHVYRDFFWREKFVANRLERLIGILDDSGEVIYHTVHYNNGPKKLEIKSFYPCQQLKNREVTFILGFTWSGLRAFDVMEPVLTDNVAKVASTDQSDRQSTHRAIGPHNKKHFEAYGHSEETHVLPHDRSTINKKKNSNKSYSRQKRHSPIIDSEDSQQQSLDRLQHGNRDFQRDDRDMSVQCVPIHTQNKINLPKQHKPRQYADEQKHGLNVTYSPSFDKMFLQRNQFSGAEQLPEGNKPLPGLSERLANPEQNPVQRNSANNIRKETAGLLGNNVECTWCGEEGHTAKDCFNLPKELNDQPEASVDVCELPTPRTSHEKQLETEAADSSTCTYDMETEYCTSMKYQPKRASVQRDMPLNTEESSFYDMGTEASGFQYNSTECDCCGESGHTTRECFITPKVASKTKYQVIENEVHCWNPYQGRKIDPVGLTSRKAEPSMDLISRVQGLPEETIAIEQEYDRGNTVDKTNLDVQSKPSSTSYWKQDSEKIAENIERLKISEYASTGLVDDPSQSLGTKIDESKEGDRKTPKKKKKKKKKKKPDVETVKNTFDELD